MISLQRRWTLPSQLSPGGARCATSMHAFCMVAQKLHVMPGNRAWLPECGLVMFS